MVNNSDLAILKRNYPQELIELVKGFFDKKKFYEDNIDYSIQVDEDKGYYEVKWVRRAIEEGYLVLSKTYLGRVRQAGF